MNEPLVVIFTAIGLDAVGIGLIVPILPRLLEDVTAACAARPRPDHASAASRRLTAVRSP